MGEMRDKVLEMYQDRLHDRLKYACDSQTLALFAIAFELLELCEKLDKGAPHA